jgi:tetratricopeptide (TPR) repeat protein
MKRALNVWLLAGGVIVLFTGCVPPATQNAEYYSNRGTAHFKKGEYDQAISDFNRALEINPRFADAYYNRGYAYGSKGQYDEAIADYSRVIELSPRFADAYYSRGFAYLNIGQHD